MAVKVAVQGTADMSAVVGARHEVEKLGTSSSVASQAWSAIGGIVRTVGTVMVGAGIAAGGLGLQTAAANEQATISFSTMLGSAQKADAFIRDMKAFAAATPFEMSDLQQASSSLLSAGVNSSKIIPIMKTLGDVTSGMGTGSQGIQRATIALQQMNAAQKISGEDLNQLRDAGIPVYDLLASALNKPKDQIVDMAAKGKLGKDALDAMMKALETGKGLERFTANGGLMVAQSQSLVGLWSTFKDTLSQGLADQIEPLVPLLKDGLGGASTFLGETALPALGVGVKAVVGGIKEFSSGWSAASGSLSSAASPMQQAGALAKQVGDAVGSAWQSMMTAVQGRDPKPIMDKVVSGISVVAEKIGSVHPEDFTRVFDAIGSGAGSAGTELAKLKPVGDAAVNLFKLVADNSDLVAKALPLLAAGFLVVKGAQEVNNVVGRDSVVGFTAQIASSVTLAASNFALAAAMRASTAASVTDTAATSGGIVARAASVASTIAHTAASVAASVAQKAMAAAQWLVNAAMSANPIGLVVIALVALVAGLVWAYQNSEDFRNVVNAAFGAVAEAGRWLWNNALAPAFRAIVGGFAWVMGGFADMLDVLGNVPGFEWAKDASAKIRGVANAARDAAAGIRDIPSQKDVEVRISVTGLVAATQARRVIADIRGGFASGGTAGSTGLYMVGEEGPELVTLERGQRVFPADQTAAFLSRQSTTPEPLLMRSAGSAPASGGGRSIVVERGAVQVTVNGGDPAAVNDAVEEAFDRLLRAMEAA